MKVLYKNKVGHAVLLKSAIHCEDCIFYPKGTSISRCKKVGLMKLCVGFSNYYEFVLSSSDVLTYETESKQ
jgi:hypothetical protein